jgi:proline iminopeptidase
VAEGGLLDVGDGHRLAYDVAGQGLPAVVLHGGPGAATSPAYWPLFDLSWYRVVLYDQRGCGRSTAINPLQHNTTQHLVADLERLREHLGIGRWLLLGGSWGATLALAYAQAHPQRVAGLVLRGVFLGEQRELDWFYGDGAARLHPEAWAQLRAALPPATEVISGYGQLLHSPEAAQAAEAWCTWSAVAATLRPEPAREQQARQQPAALVKARIENHYFRHGCFLRPGQLLADAPRLAELSGVIVHGRYDLTTPLSSAWRLHRAWPAANLQVINDAGHAQDEPGLLSATRAALGEMAGRGRW